MSARPIADRIEQVAFGFMASKVLFSTFADIGTAQGCLAVQVAQANSYLIGVGFDLLAVSSVF